MADGDLSWRGKPKATGESCPPQVSAKGRPSDYTPEMGEAVCNRVRQYGTLLEALERHPELPGSTTVYRWLAAHEDFRDGYARAREDVMEMWADDIVRVAEDETIEPNARRVRIDTKKWLMSKIAWRRYGDKLVHSGDPENPIQIMHRRAGITEMTAAELAALAQLAGALEPPTIDVTPED